MLRAGQSLADSSGDVVVLVLVPPSVPGPLFYGKAQMLVCKPISCYLSSSSSGGWSESLRAGRCYHDPGSGLKVRCLRGGAGMLSFAGRYLIDVAQ